ncbi:AMP-binding protein [Streptomyces sp. NPDC087917]|uniref:AMP-binding enzyme n=1 Tax=Streptomyces sp. NPDC087917 TaxID=3155060 RepID=UPI00344979B7
MPGAATGADDPLFCSFTSGTTSKPKMVVHTHTSYPVGHLSSMYGNGVQPGDVHLNISAPGWAKHSWGSLFVPWNAEATLLVLSSPNAGGNPPGRRPLPGSMGRPMPGYEVIVAQPGSGTPAPPGIAGELCLDLVNRPAGMLSGYLGDGAKTAAAFAGGRYHTGDLVTQDETGDLHYAGRADDMFKSFDHRIAPLELGAVLLRHPAVRQAAVVPVPDPLGMWIPKAFVTLASGGEATGATALRLLTHTREDLPEEKSIRVIEFVEELPMTASGKIQRSVLRAERTLGGEEFRPA